MPLEQVSGALKSSTATVKQTTMITKKSGKLFSMVFGNKIVLAIIILLIIAAIVFFIMRRRKKKKLAAAEAAGETEAATPGKVDKPTVTINPNFYLSIWKSFTSSLPSKFRKVLGHYKHFIVIGDQASGKSAFIKKSLDVDNFNLNNDVDYAIHPEWPIYLGNNVLVHEMPAQVLHDIDLFRKKALAKFWTSKFMPTVPKVVLVLDITTISEENEAFLSTFLAAAFDKLHAIYPKNKPIDITLVLTFLDKFAGFKTFTQVSKGKALYSQTTLAGIKTYSDNLSKLLTNGLISLENTEFTSLTRFLKEFNARVDEFAPFSKRLNNIAENQRIHANLGNLYFANLLSPSPFDQPFFVRPPEVKSFKISPHHVAAAAISLGVMGYFSSTFYLERKELNHLNSTLTIPKMASQEDQALILQDYRISLQSLKKLDSYMPDFVGVAKQRDRVEAHYVKRIRSLLLQNITARSQGELAAVIYNIALLYASNSNDLGDYVLSHTKIFADKTDLTSSLVQLYVLTSDKAWLGNVKFNYYALLTSEQTQYHMRQMLVYIDNFIQALSNLLDKPFISQYDLRYLKTTIGQINSNMPFIKEIYEVRQLLGLIDAVSHGADSANLFLDNLQQLQDKLLINQLSTIDKITSIISNTSLSLPQDVGGLGLEKFSVLLQTILNKGEYDKTPMKLSLDSVRQEVESVEFTEDAWYSLVKFSQAVLLVQKFVNDTKSSKDHIFFADAKNFEAVTFPTGLDGSVFFNNTRTVPGKYSRDAYGIYVQQPVQAFALQLGQIDLPEKIKAKLEAYVKSAVNDYANDYLVANMNYYQGLSLSVGANNSLSLLRAMQNNNSIFYAFLRQVRENTKLDFSATPLLAGMERVSKQFSFLDNMFTLDQNGNEQINNYIDILNLATTQFSQDGAQTDPQDQDQTQGDNTSAATIAAFKDKLSSLGKFALVNLVSGVQSYDSLINKWLNGLNTPQSMRSAFLEPVDRLTKLGVNSIKNNLYKMWVDYVLPDLRPVLQKFPFAANSNENVTPEELAAVIGEKGVYWDDFGTYVKPFMIQNRQGVWQPKEGFEGALPERTLYTIRQVAALKDLLWDKEGNNQALKLKVTPGSLPIATKKTTAELSFLKAGNTMVYGFNQKPAPIEMDWQWWESQSASVSLKLEKGKSAQNRYVQKSAGSEAYWSLIKLLKMAKRNDKGNYVWNVEGMSVEFGMQPDIQKLFRLEVR